MPESPLVPYQGRNDIAYVNRDLATKRCQIKKTSRVFRVSDMYIGRYGVLGYIEMSTKNEQPDLSGILEIPNKLVESMENIPGMMGYVSEVVFRRKEHFTKAYGLEDLLHPSLEGIALFDSKYYWYPYPGVRLVEAAEVGSEIKRLEEEVIKFITEFDGVLDRFVPEGKRSTYSSLLMLGPGQLE